MEGVAEGPATEEHGALYFMLWDWDRTLERIHRALYVAAREQAGREATPTAAIIDSQSAKASQRGLWPDPQGFDAGKKVTGRKRHILVDTLGLLLSVSVQPADVQDRDGARDLLRTARRLFPFVERIFADAGYQGPKMAKVVADTGCWTLQIVRRSDAHRFVVLPKRWIVERTFAWISRNRRLARDFERYAGTVAAFVRLAMIRIMLKRLTRPKPLLMNPFFLRSASWPSPASHSSSSRPSAAKPGIRVKRRWCGYSLIGAYWVPDSRFAASGMTARASFPVILARYKAPDKLTGTAR